MIGIMKSFCANVPYKDQTKILCPWDFPGKNTGNGCHFLLRGLFPTQGLNSETPNCRQILYCLNHQKSLSFQIDSKNQGALICNLLIKKKKHACILSRFSHVQLFPTLRTIAHQAPPSIGFSRQEFWRGLPFPSPLKSINRGKINK